MGKDTHALSSPAQRTALEVLAANGVETIIQRDDGLTPTPVISQAILTYNRGRTDRSGRRHRHHAVAQSARAMAGSSTIRPTAARLTPTSPTGFRIAPTNCCATAIATSNACRTHRPSGADHAAARFHHAVRGGSAQRVDLDAIRGAGVKIGVDPLGGASVALLGADPPSATS